MGEQTDIPKEFGEFIIQKQLGRGGMGQVFLAQQPSLERTVALKVLPPSAAGQDELKDRFFREAKSAAKLVHPSVVQVYAVGEVAGTPYFAMEYVEGEDLEKKLLKHEPITFEDVINIISSVLMALSHGEQHNIVHRDIKPGNIMIDRQNRVKVMDYGLAKAISGNVSNITQAGFVVGTPAYMAPEQAEGNQVDVRADLYSLGCVMYELLVGQPPFAADTPVGLIYQHIHQAPRVPTDMNPIVPTELSAIALRALEKDPDKRYQTCREMLADLMEARAALGVEATQNTIQFDANLVCLGVVVDYGRPGRGGLLCGAGRPHHERTLSRYHHARRHRRHGEYSWGKAQERHPQKARCDEPCARHTI